MESEILLQAQNACKVYDGEELFNPVSFEVKSGDRTALIGPNGGGKSTILKMIMGDLNVDEGAIVKKKNLSIGYLSQAVISGKDHTLYEEASDVFLPIKKLQEEIALLCQRMEENPQEDAIQEEYAKKEYELERLGGYDYEYKIKTILHMFGFPEEVWNRKISTFSGGEKSRMAFSKLLLMNPELLILDEPTNHLDIVTIEWLEDYLKSYQGAVLFVSHDKAFINHLATKILELENRTLSVYVGNYDQYAQEKKHRYEIELKAYNHQQEEMEKIRRFITFYMPKPRFASRAHDREKKLARLEKNALNRPTQLRNKVHIDFMGTTREDRELIRLKDVAIGYPDGDTLIKDITFTLKGQDHLVVMGANGSGKTTFIKTLMGKIKPKGGDIEFLGHLTIGYLQQDFMNVQDPRTIFNYFKDLFPSLEDQQIYDHLGKFSFSYDDDRKKTVDSLSGGEQMRVILAKLCLMNYDILILDEPTNHLDLLTKSELEDALGDYKGTLIAISHDRDFVDAIADKILYFHDGSAYYHKGSYSEFRETGLKAIMDQETGMADKEKNISTATVKVEDQEIKVEKPKKISEYTIEHLLEKISKKEEELKELKLLGDDPSYYSDPKRLKDLQSSIDAKQEEINKMYATLEAMTG